MARSGDPEGLHVETDCCLSCGVPYAYAPEIFRDGEQSCLVVRQPQTATELRRVLRVFQTQDLDCVRYGGSDARVLAILKRAGAASSCGPYFPHTAPSNVQPAVPTPLRLVLAVFGWASTLLLVGGLANAFSDDVLGAIAIGTGSAGVVLTFGAWRRRVWGYRGLLILAGLHNILALLTFFLGRHVGILGPVLFDAAALALFFLRRWYDSSATSS